jgi:hypothetical protein
MPRADADFQEMAVLYHGPQNTSITAKCGNLSAELDHPITDEYVTGLNIDEIWTAVADGSQENGRIPTARPKIWIIESEVAARLI